MIPNLRIFLPKREPFELPEFPHGKSCDEVEKLLQKDPKSSVVLEASKSAFKLLLYPSTAGRFQVGILLLTAQEDLLNKFVSGNTKLHITWDDEDIDISVDCHFQGLTPLNKCDEPIAEYASTLSSS